jgi:hypothetical protein
MNETKVSILPEMKAQIVEHVELKLIGIPCIGLKNMSDKYHHAKDSLLGLTAHMHDPKIHGEANMLRHSSSPLNDSLKQMIYINAAEMTSTESLAYHNYGVQNMPMDFYIDVTAIPGMKSGIAKGGSPLEAAGFSNGRFPLGRDSVFNV